MSSRESFKCPLCSHWDCRGRCSDSKRDAAEIAERDAAPYIEAERYDDDWDRFHQLRGVDVWRGEVSW